MSEKWLISHCEGYGVRIDEHAPVIEHSTQDERLRKRGGPGESPGGLLPTFGPRQK